MPADGVVIKRLALVRVGELTGVASGFEPELAPAVPSRSDGSPPAPPGMSPQETGVTP